jgi:hypothetical protein
MVGEILLGMCVCVCVRERERESKVKNTGTEKKVFEIEKDEEGEKGQCVRKREKGNIWKN